MIDRDRDYVLGTHDEEIRRLGLQHKVWRARMLDAWRRAGFRSGQILADIGCGPGYAALDLAEIVGPEGRVLAVDRSRRFLDALEGARARRGLRNIALLECDLDAEPLPSMRADGAWCRWVMSFLRRPGMLVGHIHAALSPGARLVLHEYFDYSTWRMAPRAELLETFVRAVMKTWRDNGGEPDVALELPALLEQRGFRLREMRSWVDVISPTDFAWGWLRGFIDVGLDRLVELGELTTAGATSVRAEFAEREAGPHAFMVTPGVLEIIAERT